MAKKKKRKLVKKKLAIQCDFEFVQVGDDGMPTPFSHWSRSSAWKDIEQGIKGVSHKRIIGAIDYIFQSTLNIQKGKKKPVVKKETVHMYAWSVQRGIRPKYKLIDAKNDIWEMIPPKDGTYTKDIPEIFNKLFRKKGTKKDLEKFDSFVGIIDIIQKYFNKKDQNKAVDAYVKAMIDKGSQKLYRDDPVTDWEVKKSSFDYMDKKLGTKILKKYTDMIDTYYNNY